MAVLYHNSILTNNIDKLGYKGNINYLKSKLIVLLEKFLFKHLSVFTLSNHYRNVINNKYPGANIKLLRLPFFQVIGSLKLNSISNLDFIKVRPNAIPNILLFGHWGPQKNPLPLLHTLRVFRKNGYNFNVKIAGGINPHFPSYGEFLNSLIEEYSDVVNEKMGYVSEKQLFPLFLSSDLVLINYNTPGGFSSVLSFAIFFQKYILISDFPEYREQAYSYDKIAFFNDNNLFDVLFKMLNTVKTNQSEIHKIIIKDRILEMTRTFTEEIQNLN